MVIIKKQNHKYLGNIKEGYYYDLTEIFGVGKEPKRFINWKLRREIRKMHKKGFGLETFEKGE